ncbi:MAG: hypothetical protein NVSMB63_16530 [Sediminibacterium sp.]
MLTGPAGAADKLPVGESAKGLLRADTYQNLNIEIQYAPGMKPQDQSVNNLVSFLNTYLNKPGGIAVTFKQVSSIGKATVTSSDVVSFTDNNRTLYTDGNHIDIYIYFADADYTQNQIIGFAFRNTAVVVFEKTVEAHSGGFNQPDRVKVESGVLEHEAGHLLGLVNNGTPMVTNHEDPSNQAHCNNQRCLMYYAIQTSGLLNMLDNGIPALDANCVNDLKANGGK